MSKSASVPTHQSAESRRLTDRLAAVGFAYRGSRVALAGGATFRQPDAAPAFSDTHAEEMNAIVAAIQHGAPWREVVRQRFASSRPWLHEIVLSPKRRTFFSLLPAGMKRVLDIGCGWGQMTLPLAASGCSVVALEPGTHRLAFVEAAARQDAIADRIAFLGANYLDCEFGRDFDVILSIGVLEWIGAFQPYTAPRDSQRAFLAQARRHLAPAGMLVIGIENRTGAKYLLGCPDDHLGAAGIACLPAEQAASRWKQTTGKDLRSFTYSEAELREMLGEAGFSDVRFWAAFPDYKLCERLIPLDDDGVALHTALGNGVVAREHNGFDGTPLSDEFHGRLDAFYRVLAQHGASRHFVPSFFVVAR